MYLSEHTARKKIPRNGKQFIIKQNKIFMFYNVIYKIKKKIKKYFIRTSCDKILQGVEQYTQLHNHKLKGIP